MAHQFATLETPDGSRLIMSHGCAVLETSDGYYRLTVGGGSSPRNGTTAGSSMRGRGGGAVGRHQHAVGPLGPVRNWTVDDIDNHGSRGSLETRSRSEAHTTVDDIFDSFSDGFFVNLEVVNGTRLTPPAQDLLAKFDDAAEAVAHYEVFHRGCRTVNRAGILKGIKNVKAMVKHVLVSLDPAGRSALLTDVHEECEYLISVASIKKSQSLIFCNDVGQ